MRPIKNRTEFPITTGLSAYSQIVTAMIRDKSLHSSLSSDGFQRFLETVHIALERGDDADRLLAVSISCKVANSTKAARPTITRILDSDSLSRPLAPLNQITDSDDRYYAANLWRFTNRPWIQYFLAAGVWEEETAEKARQECVAGLVSKCSDLGEVFALLELQLSSLRLETENPGDSLGRRLRRVLSAIRINIDPRRVVFGEDTGPKLRALLRRAFEVSGIPKRSNVKLEAGQEAFDLILHIVRSRYALALLSETYSPIVTMHDWFTSSEWRELTETDIAQELASSIQAAMELLAKSGAVDNTLLSYLDLATGDRINAARLTQEIVSRNPGLSEEVLGWLTGQPIRRSSVLASESQMVRIEEALAELLLENLPTVRLAADVESDLLPQMLLYRSLQSFLLTDLLSRFTTLSQSILNIASLRGLEVYGAAGQTEEFSPLKHEFQSLQEFGARVIRIVRPGVSVQQTSTVSRIIRKALVEAA